MYYTYIIFSKRLDVYYKGSSSNPCKRLVKHNSGGSSYTSKTDDWMLVFARRFENKTDALKYEKMLKRQNRKYLLWLIDQDFNDLKK